MENIHVKKLGLGIALILIYMFVLPLIALKVFQILHLDITNDFIYIMLNLSVYVFTLVLLLIVYRKSIFKEFLDFLKNFRSFSKIALTYWLQALVFMLLTNTIIISLTGGIAANEEGNRAIIGFSPIFSIFTMAILGPFLEEMLFRKGFKDAFSNKKFFLIFTSLLFGAAHMLAAFDPSQFEWSQFLFIIPYAGCGYFFAKAYWQTNNIFTSTLAHMIHNTLSVVLVIFGV